MSNAMKKILALLLAVVMMLSLVACGGGGEETQPQGTEGNQTPAETTEATEPFDAMAKYDETVTLTVGSFQYTMGETDENGDTYEDNAYYDYIKDKLNIELEFELVYKAHADYREALSLAITAGELPDMFLVSDQATFVELASEGLIYDISEIYELYANDSMKELYSTSEGLLDCATYDGQLMALPRVSTPGDAFVHVRQDWVDQLGLKVDEDGDHLITLEEIEMLADAFIKADLGNTGNPVGFSTRVKANDGNYTLDLVNQTFGVVEFEWLKNEDGTVTNGTIDPDMKEALSWWADMYQKGLLDPNFGISGTSEVKAMLASGQMGIVLGCHNGYMYSTLAKDAYVAQPTMDFTTYGLDNGNGQMTYCAQFPQDRWLCISKDCENPEAVIKLMNLYADLKMGNEDAELAELRNYTYYDPIPMEHILRTTGDIAGYEAVMAYLAGEITLDEVPETWQTRVDYFKACADGTADPDARRMVDQYMSSVVMETLFNNGKHDVTYNIPPVPTDVMLTYGSEIQDYAYETFVKIVTGEVQPDYFDEFVEEWLSRGGAAIIEDLEANWNY